ncbi:MAG TPA: tryptophan 7-halogenase [Candidatus Polarisedimenticolaceae bacterium]|nr:tryptophan 7-halogenase [Candidatus Polarisedimenticolaceae bacterium]
MSVESTDVLILGGGPAGSAAAIALADRGVQTVVVEGETFPRFHVGESLLPHSLPLFDRLGVHDRVAALPHSLRKEGASFATHDGARYVEFWFEDAFAPAIPNAYQVRRDEFDAMLLDTARERGADVRVPWKATKPHWDGDRLAGAWVRPEGGEERLLHAKCVLDATGQHAFLATRMNWKTVYDDHRKMAVVGHFDGVAQNQGRAAGNITIVVTSSGWFWFIPFRTGTTSVGAVFDVGRYRHVTGGLEAMFDAVVENTPEAARRLANATRTLPAQAVQNFSFRVSRIHGDGFALVGDAAGFLDPIFSTGVFIGTTTAVTAADAIVAALARRGRVDAADFAGTAARARDLQKLFFSFIRSYYDPHFLAFFFDPHDGMQIPKAIVTLLAANVLRSDRWRWTSRFRMLQTLARGQRVAQRFGKQIVPPLASSPG